MTTAVDTGRWLAAFDTARMPQRRADVLVIGAGAAGLRAAIEAADDANVLVLDKSGPTETASDRAQGGIAAAIRTDDSPEDHAADTLAAGGGLCHDDVVRRVAHEAPGCIRELLDWGAQFDGRLNEPEVGREGGHGKARIVHARGDGTGAELMRVLRERAAATPNIQIVRDCFTVDLLTVAGRVVGVLAWRPSVGLEAVRAGATILATGGAGRLFRHTTNPAVATGDGLAIAFRAGAVVRDLEFIQFHPTVVPAECDDDLLISEAVRGDGAFLRDCDGRRFLLDVDPRAELAPRDVVSRAEYRRMRQTATTCVQLDVRHFSPGRFSARFPGASAALLSRKIDPVHDLIPVRPAAHYVMGGVVTDALTRTNLPGLLACGEVASSGLHGANRLASNSLLEALVFGRQAGQTALRDARSAMPRDDGLHIRQKTCVRPGSPDRLEQIRQALRDAMWAGLGVERDHAGIARAADAMNAWDDETAGPYDTPDAWETRNLLTLGRCIAAAALARTESRGAHYRVDFPRESADWRLHLELIRKGRSIQLNRAVLP